MEEIRKEEDLLKERIDNEQFGNVCPVLRKKVWDLMEKPQTSRYARVSTVVLYDSLFFCLKVTFVLVKFSYL